MPSWSPFSPSYLTTPSLFLIAAAAVPDRLSSSNTGSVLVLTHGESCLSHGISVGPAAGPIRSGKFVWAVVLAQCELGTLSLCLV